MRKWIANKLASLARRIYPKSEEVMAFYTDRMIEAVVFGQSTLKIGTVPPGTMWKLPPSAAGERKE